ncbi:hypothetical protein BJY04DRAFT_194808 [Aspergillus karnatakaensis]|uniref:uncharacterized protein n=1 Tax=Aspergillus karnatakaensis TaxID=1810916 RepID=UPI003CCDBDE5
MPLSTSSLALFPRQTSTDCQQESGLPVIAGRDFRKSGAISQVTTLFTVTKFPSVSPPLSCLFWLSYHPSFDSCWSIV